jgi:hypothetical protein
LSKPRWQIALHVLFFLRRRPRLVLAFLLALQVLHGTYGINQDVVWGHSGFHIGEYGTQAVHLRRHGSFIPAESDEFRPPRNEDLELRHPFLLHPYIAAVQSVFGERPWTARVVPFAFSLLALCGMWSLVRRTRDVLTAHVSTAFFVLSPLNAAFSHLPEYQISAIAWTLWAFVGVHETLKKPTRFSIAQWLVCAALAGLTDWPWFEMAFFFFFIIAWRLRPNSPTVRRVTPREATVMRATLATFCVVVLVTFVQHFAIVKHLGQVEALRHSFSERTNTLSWAEYKPLLLARLPQMHTLPVLVATALWVLRALFTWRKDMATALLMSVFLGMTLDLKLFPGAFAYHEYRDAYWYVPVFALASADVTLSAAHWLARRFRSKREAVLVPLIASLVALGVLSKDTIDMVTLSRARGGSVSMAGNDPHVADFTVARIAHHLGKGRKIYLGDGMAPREEMHWLIEAPHEDLSSLSPLQDAMARQVPFLVVDRISALRTYPEWAAIARECQVFLIDSSAVMLWTPSTPPSLETARLEFVPRTRLSAWLHAEPTEVAIGAGAVSDAIAVANDIAEPAEVIEKILRLDRPLLRRVPRFARSRGTR